MHSVEYINNQGALVSKSLKKGRYSSDDSGEKKMKIHRARPTPSPKKLSEFIQEYDEDEVRVCYLYDPLVYRAAKEYR